MAARCTLLLFAAALIALAASTAIAQPAIPGPAEPPPKEPSPPLKPLALGQRLTGTPLLVADPPPGSYCPDAAQPLTDGLKVGDLTFREEKGDWKVFGRCIKLAPLFKLSPYKPTVPVEGKPVPQNITMSAADVAKGVDIEMLSLEGAGKAVIRVEKTWRGFTWGVISGWGFVLDDTYLFVVDATLDGRVGWGDRMLYADSSVWMPFHRFVVGRRMVYANIKADGGDGLVCDVSAMDDPGKDADVFDAWNAERRTHGIPPGAYDQRCSANCVKHAEYLQKIDFLKTRGEKQMGSAHDEDADLPGYSKDGREAGMSSCISWHRSTALRSFLDSPFHRPQLISPSDCCLQLGGNSYAFLMGGAWGSKKNRLDLRTLPEPQRYPAPGTTVVNGRLFVDWPAHAALKSCKTPGLPIICRMHQQESVSDVSCELYRVKGDMKTGVRGTRVGFHLSYPNHESPKEFPDNFGQIMAVPLEVLEAGVYEVMFQFKPVNPFNEEPQQWKFTWRFAVAAK